VYRPRRGVDILGMSKIIQPDGTTGMQCIKRLGEGVEVTQGDGGNRNITEADASAVAFLA